MAVNSLHVKNPYLTKNMLRYSDGTKAGYGSIISKVTFFILLTFLGVAFYIYNPFAQYNMLILLITGVFALVTPFVINFNPSTAPFLGSIYCISEGYVVAYLCTYFESKYQGIVVLALCITMLTFIVMLFLYSTGLIKVGRKLRSIIFTLFLVSILFSGIAFVSSFFTPVLINLLYGNGVVAIGISVVMVVITALNLLVDFDNISMTVQNGMPKKYEWFVSYGLVITLVLLFIRILNLLAKILRRND